jgi:phage anti-repressor protein
MNTEVSVRSSFVAPHFIPELGEEGLTLHEVAQSLEIEFKEAKRVLEKNINDYSTVEISTVVNRGFAGQQEVTSYALNTEDAKFFVAGYNNGVGKSYRRFLIQCEKAVMQIAQRTIQSPHAKAEEIFGVFMRVAAMMEVPKHYAQIEASKEAYKHTGIDFSPMLQLTSAQDNIPTEEVMLEPTELAEALDVSSAIAMNRVLRDLGLQKKRGGEWVPTPLGEGMCSRHAWKKDGKSGYNLKWKLSAVKEAIEKEG